VCDVPVFEGHQYVIFSVILLPPVVKLFNLV